MPVSSPLLDALLTAESRQDLPACAAAMRALAEGLRAPTTRPTLQATLTEWFLEALPAPDGDPWREAVWDASADLLADAAALGNFMELVAQRVEDLRAAARPNLCSMLRARAQWRAKDRMRRQISAQTSAAGALFLPETQTPFEQQARLIAAVAVQRLGVHFGDDPLLVDLLRRLLMGETISEVSENTGVSRQSIYRALARIREYLTPPETAAEPFVLPRAGNDHV